MSRLGSMVVRIALENLAGYKADLDEAAKTATRAADVVVTAMKAVAGSYAAIKLFGYASDAALLNARYETLGVSMKVVGQNAGYTGIQMEAAAQGMQKMGISMVESRQQAMRMVQAHIDLADSQKLARIAQDAAVIGNMNSSEAFANMIHGIQTGQTDVLRTIGLNVNMEQSYKVMAATLGKNADALTQNEKTQAVLNAVMKAGEGIAGTYAASMGTAGKQLQSMKRYTEDLQVKVGEVFNESLTIGVMAFTDELKDANKEMSALSSNGDLNAWGEGVTDVFLVVADNANNLIGAMKVIGYTAAALAAGSNLEIWDNAGRKAIKEQYDRDVAAVYAGEDRFSKAAEKRRATVKEQAEKDARVAATIAGDRLGRFDLHKYADTPATVKTSGGISEATKGLQLYNNLVATSTGLSADFAEKWALLNAAFRARKITLEELTIAQAQMLKGQEFSKNADKALEEQTKASAKADKEAADARQQYIADLDKGLATMEQELAQQLEHNERLGLSKTAVAELDAAKLESLATVQDLIVFKKIEQGLDEDAYRIYVAQAKALRDRAAAIKAGAYKETGLEDEKAIAAERQAGWVETDRIARETFTTIAENGTNAAEVVGKAFKKALLSAIYEATIRPVAFQIYSSIAGGNTTDISGGTQGVVGAANAVNSASSAMSWATNFDSAASNAFAKVGSSLINNSGSSKAMGDFGASLVENSDKLASYTKVLGNSLNYLQAFDAAQKGEWGKAIGTAVGTYIGGPVLGQITGAIGSAVDRAFGGGQESLLKTYTKGTLSSTGFSGGNFKDVHNSGNWFNSGYDKTVDLGKDAALNDALSGAFGVVKAQTAMFAQALGLNADSIAGYSKDITLEFTADKAANQKLIADTFTGIANEIALGIEGIGAVQVKETETTADALARLATSLTTANDALFILDQTLFDVGISGADSASKLIDAFGGVQNFTSALASYYTNYYSAEEQRAQTVENIAKTLNAAGASLTSADVAGTTRETFRALVEGQDLNTEAGRKTYAALMSVQGAFADLTTEAKAATTAIDAQTDAQRALQAAWSAEGARLDALAKDSADRLLAGQQAVADLRDEATQQYLDAQQRVTDAQRNLAEVLHTTIKGFEDFLGTLDGAQTPTARLAGARQNFDDLSARARTGDTAAVGQLTASAKTFLDLSKGYSATIQDYRRDEARVRNVLNEGIRAGNAQLALLPKEMQQATDPLKAAYEQLAQATADEQAARVLAIAMQASLTSTEKSLGDKYLDAIKALPDEKALKKFYDDTLSAAADAAKVAAAAAAAAVAILARMTAAGAAGGATADPGTPTATAKDTTLHGVGGIAMFDTGDISAGGGSIGAGEAIAQLNAYAQYNGKDGALARIVELGGTPAMLDRLRTIAGPSASFDVGIDDVPYDMTARVHKGEKIFKASDNRELMTRLSSPQANSSALAEEVKLLRSQNDTLGRELGAALAQIALYLRGTADSADRIRQLEEKWDAKGTPPNRAAL